jgi:hypothetical protein
VADFLSYDNRAPFEKTRGDFTVIIPRRREIHASVVEAFKDGSLCKQAQRFFSDSREESTFTSAIQPQLKQTAIFIDRFFLKMSYTDLAEKYSTPRSAIAKLYVNAKERLVKTVAAMDRAELARSNGEALATMPRGVRAFLLHTLLGLSVTEIANLLNVTHPLVTRQIADIRDRLLAGESIDILPAAAKDREAAHARIRQARQARAEYDRRRCAGGKRAQGGGGGV